MMNIQKKAAVLAALMALASPPVLAQWLNQKTAGVPRNADGTPNLTAPAPRTPDGKADLSGIWQANGVKYLRQDPRLVLDTELLEFICNENEKDIVHMRPK